MEWSRMLIHPFVPACSNAPPFLERSTAAVSEVCVVLAVFCTSASLRLGLGVIIFTLDGQPRGQRHDAEREQTRVDDEDGVAIAQTIDDALVEDELLQEDPHEGHLRNASIPGFGILLETPWRPAFVEIPLALVEGACAAWLDGNGVSHRVGCHEGGGGVRQERDEDQQQDGCVRFHCVILDGGYNYGRYWRRRERGSDEGRTWWSGGCDSCESCWKGSMTASVTLLVGLVFVVFSH
mmetsp:Transcript_19110/g.53088  ORF Transcript_19110/g.53088 Transcript_19110/m.53088 type:complete len:237 (-) Transcript_19110:85-795(-)